MDDEVKQQMALGRGCFVKRQYAQAERYLEQVLERTQSFADAYNMLGVIYHDQGRLERSEESFRTALRLNPAYTEAALNLAVACNDLGKYEEAKEAYQAALSGANGAAGGLDRFAQGKIANMHAEIADVYASCGRWAEAIGEYRRALELGPSFVDIRLKLADALREGGDLPRAIAELARLVEEHPQYEPAQVRYGQFLYLAGRKAEAIEIWEAISERNPENKSASIFLKVEGQHP